MSRPVFLRAMSFEEPVPFIGAVEDEWDLYSDIPTDYTKGSPIGFGASSIVYAAKFLPKTAKAPAPCALKVLDLDRLPPHSLSLLQRETTLMSLSKHPNVLRVRGSWMDGHKLYIAMRLMNKGSAADVMRYGWPGGMEEDVVRCVLRQALQGLNYLHINGFIHRDVKAANMLIDDDGTVLLGDLGVAANLAEDSSDSVVRKGDRSRPNTQTAVLKAANTAHEPTKKVVTLDPLVDTAKPKMGKRKSFVGTPCWMAPELIQGRQYDAAADIWSFGITALELAQGRAPRSRESSSKVLLKTVQDPPPTLDRLGGTHKYSRAFQEMIESCLVKNPSMRPSAEQLLQTAFFRGAKKKSYLVGAILKDLPPLIHRQERRRAPSLIPGMSVHGTTDSWDFSTTVGAGATTSVYRRHALEGLALEDGEIFHTELGRQTDVLETEDETESEWDHGDEDEDETEPIAENEGPPPDSSEKTEESTPVSTAEPIAIPVSTSSPALQVPDSGESSISVTPSSMASSALSEKPPVSDSSGASSTSVLPDTDLKGETVLAPLPPSPLIRSATTGGPPNILRSPSNRNQWKIPVQPASPVRPVALISPSLSSPNICQPLSASPPSQNLWRKLTNKSSRGTLAKTKAENLQPKKGSRVSSFLSRTASRTVDILQAK